MQIKKCQWINKPEHVKIISSKTLEFIAEKEHLLLYTFVEEGTLYLSWDNNENVDIEAVYLNTDVEHITFSFLDNQTIKNLQLRDIKTTNYFPPCEKKQMEITKKGDVLTFFLNEKEISSLKRTNIKASVSLGLKAKGCGKVTFCFAFSPF